MALKRLSTAQMISLTKDWVTPGTAVRLAFERVLCLKALLPHIEDIYARVLAAERLGQAKSHDELTRELGKVDKVHDNIVRGIYYSFEAEYYFALARDDHEQAEALQAMRRYTCPEGLATVGLSYRDESGQTDMVAARLDHEDRNFLASIPVIGGTLLNRVDDWIQAGQTIGALENQRVDNIRPEDQQHGGEARSMWIQMVITVRSNVRLANVQEPEILKALHRIERAEAAAEAAAAARAARSGEPDEPDEPTEPTEPTEPPLEDVPASSETDLVDEPV